MTSRMLRVTGVVFAGISRFSLRGSQGKHRRREASAEGDLAIATTLALLHTEDQSSHSTWTTSTLYS